MSGRKRWVWIVAIVCVGLFIYTASFHYFVKGKNVTWIEPTAGKPPPSNMIYFARKSTAVNHMAHIFYYPIIWYYETFRESLFVSDASVIDSW